MVPVILLVLIAGFFFTQGEGEGKNIAYAELEGDLKILKSEITSDAKFYPFSIDGTNMEVLALKAEDGTVRTALNTCQVCYNSRRGYYKQDPVTKELVCQNCGNRFAPENVELIKGGCNPIPITPEIKTDDGTTITITKELLKEGKFLFSNWSKS
ncbi:MAG TPA: DUF2318 domain-containing protein [Peptococcaceae bacterium]|nr:DUF2318 domain-containing protein [Peptococcaceae bacterium]